MLLPCYEEGRVEAGCDEAGRGCLSGPVVCAAVILPDGWECETLDDSKKLTAKKRNELREIIEREALAWGVAFVNPEEIDKINILNASITGMHRALDSLNLRPDFILVDGNRFKAYRDIPHRTIVKGDGKYMSIAAASILAKTHRDEYMEKAAQHYFGYNWEKNKGYPTREHRKAIQELGLTPLHRRSFAPCNVESLFSADDLACGKVESEII